MTRSDRICLKRDLLLSFIRLHAEWNSHAVSIFLKIEFMKLFGFRRSVVSGGFADVYHLMEILIVTEL